MTDDYTPSMEEIRRALGLAGTKWQRGAFDRAIATHDAELRAEIAAEIRASQDPCGPVGDSTCNGGMEHAATIAEGKS